MPEEKTGCVYFLSGGETDSLKQNLRNILEKVSVDSGSDTTGVIVISNKRQLINHSGVQGFPQYIISLCRQHNLLRNDRVTVLSAMDQLIALQLCLAEKNKQEKGDFDIETSIVMQSHKDIVNRKMLSHDGITLSADITSSEDPGIEAEYQKFLKDCNYMDFCDIYTIFKQEYVKNEELRKQIEKQIYVFLDVPKSKPEQTLLEFLCTNRNIKTVTVEVPLDTEQEITATISDSCLATILDTTVPPSTVKKPVSVTEETTKMKTNSSTKDSAGLYKMQHNKSDLGLHCLQKAYVRLVYLSYLELLINSRSELSLARVINVPERELTHTAFTELKHTAKQKNMTMYQTATSYVMKLRLGGKGYAPDPNCALGQHIKGMGEFVTLMQKIEEVIEEDQDIRSACGRVVKIIRKEMIKCRDSKLRPASVDAVAEQLQEQITNIIDVLDQQIINTPDKPASNGGSLTSRRARKALRHLLDKLATVDDDLSTLDHLTDIYSSQRTPLRFPSVLSQFRSPVEELEVTSPENKYNLSLSERVLNRQNKAQTPVYAKRFKAANDWAVPVHSADITKDDDVFSPSQVYIIPTKTIVHAGSKFSSGEANQILESMLDQENNTEESKSCCRPDTSKSSKTANNNKTKVTKDVAKDTVIVSKETKVAKEKGTKRPLEGESSSQAQKKQKGEKSNKTVRRKLLPQVKGQQQLTKFFRM